LRKPADTSFLGGIKKDTHGVEKRTSKYWLVLIELKLIFFQSPHDSRGRYTIAIHDAEVSLQSDPTTVRLTFSDKRSWLFEFESKLLAKRFEFSIVETQKYHSNKSSVYIKGKNRYEDSLRPYVYSL